MSTIIAREEILQKTVALLTCSSKVKHSMIRGQIKTEFWVLGQNKIRAPAMISGPVRAYGRLVGT